MSDVGLGELARCENLKVLKLNCCNEITGLGFQNFIGTGLKRLNLDMCEGIIDDSLALISQIESLERLTLNRLKISDEGLQYLGIMPNLKTLFERVIRGFFSFDSDMRITGDAFEHFNKSHLKTLSLLDIQTLTEQGLKNISCIENLQVLHLDTSSVTPHPKKRQKLTDEGLKDLEKLTHLRELSLNCCLTISGTFLNT
ncbi:MAG: hypothetical protein HWD61_15820 [Parachlamydiaceae bacterium]|nr:MAG: hypothetical protein HWD61_15820 [Parachlamydiaceae bacterium]